MQGNDRVDVDGWWSNRPSASGGGGRPRTSQRAHRVRCGSVFGSIDQNVAKCIWGTSSLGASASISVISQDGVKQIATTSIGAAEGQLNFSASGFHFSTNKISVSLGKIVTPVTLSGRNALTITCTKGKLTKKVTAVNPKCPAGYKKK